MVEITGLWLDLVSEIRQCKPELIDKSKDKNRILRKSEESALSKQRSAIVQLVGQLKELLNNNRESYMVGEVGGGRGMSQQDMDTLDASADHICLKCSELIQNYNTIIDKTKLSNTAKEHYRLVSVGLQNYLKKVLSIHSEMRAVRVKKQVQLTNLTKLELNSLESRSHQINSSTPSKSSLDLQQKSFTAAASAKSRNWESSDEDEELSPEEAQLLEQENRQLIEQLNSITNQVDQTASKVLKISELQEIFSEKVLQQSTDIQHIHAQAVTATENVKEGNEAVRQAIQNQASYRVMVLFVLLVFSFALLFLDWYND